MLFVTKLSMFPFNLAISLTNFDEIICLSGSDIKNTVSIFLLSCLFIPASWNSYSKSDTARNPLNIIAELCFMQKVVVKVLNGNTDKFFLLNFKSIKRDFFIIETLSSEENK